MPSKSTPNTSHLYQVLIAMIHSRATLPDLRKSMSSDWNWEFVASSEREMYLVSKDPTACEGGTWWFCNITEKTYAKRPEMPEIDKLLDTIAFPSPQAAGRPPCKKPCDDHEERQTTWDIMRHKITNKWGLAVSKQCRWTCVFEA